MANIEVEEINPDTEAGKIIQKLIINDFWKKYVMVGKDRTVLTSLYLEYMEKIKHFEVYDDDIWVISYPKSGTTWTQEMIWMIVNNLDFEGAKTPVHQRFPFLELSALVDKGKLDDILNVPFHKREIHSIELARTAPRPRFIKTHLPFSLLPEQIQNGTKSPKIICTIRNPKDVCVSYYHHGTLLMGWQVSLEKHTELFMANKSLYGSYWKHLNSYWNLRQSKNFLMIKYEDMKSDLSLIIRKVAQFLKKDLSEEQIQLLCQHLSFESMKSNPSVNYKDHVETMRLCNLVIKEGEFIRSGIVGKYQEELSTEIIIKFNKWIKENISGTDFEDEPIFQI